MSAIGRRQAAKQFRGSAGFRGAAQDVPIPLPLKGVFSDAAEAETGGQYAARMTNLRSTGLLIEMVPGFTYETAASTVTARASFDFGLFPYLIDIGPSGLTAGTTRFMRTFGAYPSITALSSNILFADGLGAPVRFDGTTFTESAFTTSTGADPATFDGILAHHDRPYLWKRNGPLEFYHGDIGAVTGALTRFPLNRLGNISGGMHSMASLTVDAGHGMNDVLAIFTTTGDVVIYEGLDPSDEQDWRIFGRFKIAPPIGSRPFASVGGDVWVLTTGGVVSMVETIRQNAMALVSQVTRPVMKEIVAAVEEGGEWQLHASANNGMVIVNRVLNGAAKQWVYFTEAQAWVDASYPAAHWHNHLGKTGFTSLNGRFCCITYTQGAGEVMTAVLHTGWIRGPANGLTCIIPTIKAKGPLSVRIAVLSDHDETGADLAEAWQTVELHPETDPTGGETIRLGDEFGVDAVGDVYQIRMEMTAAWLQIVNLRAKAV